MSKWKIESIIWIIIVNAIRQMLRRILIRNDRMIEILKSMVSFFGNVTLIYFDLELDSSKKVHFYLQNDTILKYFNYHTQHRVWIATIDGSTYPCTNRCTYMKCFQQTIMKPTKLNDFSTWDVERKLSNEERESNLWFEIFKIDTVRGGE